MAILGTFTIKRGGRATQLVSGPYSATIADDGVGLSSIVLSEEEGDTLFFPFREVILTVVRPVWPLVMTSLAVPFQRM